MDSSVVRAAARDAFKVISASTPGWADPRPDGQPPEERDYENCTDPGRFRILAARAEAWTKALTQTELAAWMLSGLSLNIGSCGPDLRPSVARALGAVLSSDRRQLRMHMARRSFIQRTP